MKKEKTPFQITISTFVIIAGLFVVLTTGANITGNVIGNSGNTGFLEFIAVFWGMVVMGAGIWMISRKDFHESIFEK
jgi:hypothetical protein